MFEQLCPKCGKNSYSADEIYFSASPYCGCRFSGKYGPDRRHDERVKEETAIIVNYQGLLLKATSTDLSKEGVGIRIFGEAPVAVGETVELSISEFQIKAKALWINKLSNKSLVGLQRLKE